MTLNKSRWYVFDGQTPTNVVLGLYLNFKSNDQMKTKKITRGY